MPNLTLASGQIGNDQLTIELVKANDTRPRS